MFRFGLVRFGSVWFGLVRFGSVWFGLVRFGLVWFGLVRSGLVPVSFSFSLLYFDALSSLKQCTGGGTSIVPLRLSDSINAATRRCTICFGHDAYLAVCWYYLIRLYSFPGVFFRSSPLEPPCDHGLNILDMSSINSENNDHNYCT